MKLIIRDVLVEEEDIKRLQETTIGKLQVEAATRNAIVGYAGDSAIGYIQNELKALSRDLTYDEIQLVNAIIYRCLFDRKEADLDKYIEDVAKILNENEGPIN